MKQSYIYILLCSDKTYYTGITSNLNKRIIEHQFGKHPESYTYKRRPLTLVFYAEFTDINLAIKTEKQIKKWSRAKKEALINNAYEKLPNLSKRNLIAVFLQGSMLPCKGFLDSQELLCLPCWPKI